MQSSSPLTIENQAGPPGQATPTRVLDVSLEEIQRAQERIRSLIYFSPCQHSADLSQMTGQQVYLKLDNLQRTGAFKERGALNKILHSERRREKARRDRGQRR